MLKTKPVFVNLQAATGTFPRSVILLTCSLLTTVSSLYNIVELSAGSVIVIVNQAVSFGAYDACIHCQPSSNDIARCQTSLIYRQ